jgi:predicted dehydrogenase
VTPAALTLKGNSIMHSSEKSGAVSRRDFFKASAVVSGLTMASSAYAAGNDIIRVGVIGCGSRGPGAALNAMVADPGVRIVALADMRMERMQEKRNMLKVQRPGQVQVDDDHCFVGFDAYKRVIASSDVVIIANAAKFHPMHLRAAIDAGKHVFAEKPHAIDPAGIKVVRAACDKAREKNLCVVSGLHSRYLVGYRETIQRIHDGVIGEIVATEENFLRAPYQLYPRKPGMTEAEFQASNQYHFHWLSGDDVVQSLVHNLDRASWALKDQAPVKCHGMGGRSTLHAEVYGTVFDHNSVVYEFASGARIYAFCRTVPNCYNEYSSKILGTKGTCDLMKMRITGENKWQFSGKVAGAQEEGHQYEHVELFRALRAGKVINNGDYMIRSTLIGVMGQISCYTGAEVKWDQISASDFEWLPRPEECRLDMTPPVVPDAQGIYPTFKPGVTKLL